MSIGGFFKGLVPYLAAVAENFGGPAGVIAASVLTKVTSSTVKPPDIAGVISNLATTEQGRVQLDSAEKEYAETMAKMGYDSAEKHEQALVDDRASARLRESSVRDHTPAILAYCTLVGSIIMSVIVLSGKAPALHDPIEAATVGTIVGFVFRDLAHVYAYYFGGDGSSDNGSSTMK